ncbi:hypothetical protein E2C01_026645 [Portunus trituberculatus]|uniref:Uncharacterized protein n=1 Tax=Portunus trituberculatus TaxID=210409 RepID=A0A5B7EG39_PORTR|nr:hypothetical protein [Portunus trituberculatus]
MIMHQIPASLENIIRLCYQQSHGNLLYNDWSRHLLSVD